MAVLGVKKVFGLISAGTSTVRKVGFFACFDVPKETLRFCLLTQKEILLFPFRCADIIFKAVHCYLTHKQPAKNRRDISDKDKSEGSLLRSPVKENSPRSDSSSNNDNNTVDKESFPPAEGSIPKADSLVSSNAINGADNESLPPAERNSPRADSLSSDVSNGADKEPLPPAEGSIPSADSLSSSVSNDAENKSLSESMDYERLTQAKKLDPLTVSTNRSMDNVPKHSKVILSKIGDWSLEMGDWRVEMQERFAETDIVIAGTDKVRSYFFELEKEVYFGLHAVWALWKRFKSRRKEMSEDFHEMTRKCFSSSVPKTKNIYLEALKEVSNQNDFLETLIEPDFLKAKLKTIESSLQILCPKTSDGERVLKDFEGLKAVVIRIAKESEKIRFSMSGNLKDVKKIIDLPANSNVEIFDLANQFHKMLSIEAKLQELQYQLEDAKELLLRAECNRDDMVWKLETLAKMVKEEDNFYNDSTYSAKETSLSSTLAMECNEIN